MIDQIYVSGLAYQEHQGDNWMHYEEGDHQEDGFPIGFYQLGIYGVWCKTLAWVL